MVQEGKDTLDESADPFKDFTKSKKSKGTHPEWWKDKVKKSDEKKLNRRIVWGEGETDEKKSEKESSRELGKADDFDSKEKKTDIDKIGAMYHPEGADYRAVGGDSTNNMQ